ncbi:hypothetical protein C8R46DRAFT_1024381 [Mycena filopes]|nr:hypothetical protein C8R46DRAFT_1024381 [Mycena filopes]
MPSFSNEKNYEELVKFNTHFSTQIDLSPLPVVQAAPPSQSTGPPSSPLPPFTTAGRWRVPSPIPENPLPPFDWWHNDNTNIRLIKGTGDLWPWTGDHMPFFSDHIPFVSDDGPERCPPGVSMTLARLGDGMFHGGVLVSRFIHPVLLQIADPVLCVQWPGYCAVGDPVNGCVPLKIQQPLRLREDTTIAELGYQVAEYFFKFAAGVSWNAEIGAVDDYVQD